MVWCGVSRDTWQPQTPCPRQSPSLNKKAIHNALCALHFVLNTMRFAQCAKHIVQSVMCFTLCVMFFVAQTGVYLSETAGGGEGNYGIGAGCCKSSGTFF